MNASSSLIYICARLRKDSFATPSRTLTPSLISMHFVQPAIYTPATTTLCALSVDVFLEHSLCRTMLPSEAVTAFDQSIAIASTCGQFCFQPQVLTTTIQSVCAVRLCRLRENARANVKTHGGALSNMSDQDVVDDSKKNRPEVSCKDQKEVSDFANGWPGRRHALLSRAYVLLLRTTADNLQEDVLQAPTLRIIKSIDKKFNQCHAGHHARQAPGPAHQGEPQEAHVRCVITI